MSQPPELWTTAVSTLLLLVVGGALAAVSYLAYRREERRSLRTATVGFALLTAGSVVIPFYQSVVRRSYVLGGVELLRLQTVQTTMVALGLLALVYSLYQ
ncbi:hypothetical protein ACFPYI_11940 [Halomarina salina]|uniref:Uncharacterized protein n=1 Tax=Halomarina salina TaxID=1872699 RepID=A0ABD5RN26_9EURY|nr:hypothetical protein [Halomarina salina]